MASARDLVTDAATAWWNDKSTGLIDVLGNQVQAALDEAFQAGVASATSLMEEGFQSRIDAAVASARSDLRAAVIAAIGDA